MNIIDHELKRHDLWQEELNKKKKVDILSHCMKIKHNKIIIFESFYFEVSQIIVIDAQLTPYKGFLHLVIQFCEF